MKHKITVIPENKVIEVTDGANLRTSLLTEGHEVKSPCGGCASCGQCIVVIKEGGTNLSDISFEEKQLIGNVFHITGERLSCQTEVHGDVVVDVSAHVPKPSKPKPEVKRRTREDYDKIIEERKENSKNKPEKQGGFRRPRAFQDDDGPSEDS